MQSLIYSEMYNVIDWDLCACIREGKQSKKMRRVGVPGEHSHMPTH